MMRYTQKTFLIFAMAAMDQDQIQKRCKEFLEQLGVPGFIVFGWKKNGEEYGLVSAYHDVQPQAAIKGLSWALNDFISKSM